MSELWNNMIDLRLARPDRGLIILIRLIVNNACSYQQVLQASSGLCRRVSKWTSASSVFNTSRPRQNGRHFPDDIFKCIFLNENVWISIRILSKFVPQGPINIIPSLVQIMAWCRPGDKPLSETMMPRLLTHICVSRSQWVKSEVSGRFITSNYDKLLKYLYNDLWYTSQYNVEQKYFILFKSPHFKPLMLMYTSFTQNVLEMYSKVLNCPSHGCSKRVKT